MDYRWRGLGFALALVVVVGCGDDDESSSGSNGGSGSGSGSASSLTSGASSSSTTADSATGGGSPGSCGWAGSVYACGFNGVDPGGSALGCPGSLVAGDLCSSTDDPTSCCDAQGNAWQCSCDGQACNFMWTTVDCAHSAGSGACGWWPEGNRYSCGGDGMDAGGTPMACPDPIGGSCMLGVPNCCDANGDQWQCGLEPVEGTGVWEQVEC